MLLLLMAGPEREKTQTDRQTEKESERVSSYVKSICFPLGVSTNYCLISRTEALLLALFH